tara:strand:- start:4944 stop:5114 length:171 start_codon:yes stop_codon:yes gene_type:complete
VKAALLTLMLALLVSCGPPNPNDDPAGRADTRQKPTNLTPGVTFSGYVNIGVIKRF